MMYNPWIHRLKLAWVRLPMSVKALFIFWIGAYVVSLFLPKTFWAQITQFSSLCNAKCVVLHPWKLITYALLHSAQDLLGLLVGIIIVWVFCGWILRKVGEKGFWIIALAGTVVGGLVHTGAITLLTHQSLYSLGSGAVVFSILAASWVYYGETPILLWGIAKPFRFKWLFFAIVGLEILFFIAGNNQAFFMQIGGAAGGYLASRYIPSSFVAQTTRKRPRFRVINGGKQYM